MWRTHDRPGAAKEARAALGAAPRPAPRDDRPAPRPPRKEPVATVIHPSGTFDYEAEFTEECFGASDIVLQGADRRGGGEECLVGPSPKLRLWEDRLAIFTPEKRRASMRDASFPVGDAVGLAARPGDRLYVSRDGTGGIGLSLLRARELVLAVGAVADLPLGAGVSVSRGSDGSWEKPSRNTWLEFEVGSERVALRGREFARAGDYHLYVERCWAFGIPGTSECAAVWAGDDPAMRIAAIRSAVLLGHGELKVVGWDNGEEFIELNRWAGGVIP